MEHEALGESTPFAGDLLVQSADGNLIELGKIGIKHHSVAADQQDGTLDRTCT